MLESSTTMAPCLEMDLRGGPAPESAKDLSSLLFLSSSIILDRFPILDSKVPLSTVTSLTLPAVMMLYALASGPMSAVSPK